MSLTSSRTPTSPDVDVTVLDNAAWHALNHAHREFAEGIGAVRRYRPDVSVFSATLDDTPASWDELLTATPPDEAVVLFRALALTPTDDWDLHHSGPGFQMLFVADRAEPRALPAIDPQSGRAIRLRPLVDADIPAMTALVALTEPGPFRPRTIDLGGYVGIFHDNELVAMAGQRLRPPGFCEISAVCTHPSARRRGYASAVTLHVAAGIIERGERPFLHLAASNTAAMSVYERIGFEVRTTVGFGVYLRRGGNRDADA